MKKKAISGSRRAYILTMRILMGAAAVITAALVLFLIAYVLIKLLYLIVACEKIIVFLS